jgi:hypothetical protein
MCQQRCLERGWSLGLECPPRGRQQRGVDHIGTMAVEHPPDQAAAATGSGGGKEHRLGVGWTISIRKPLGKSTDFS